jgi:lysozyme
MLKNKKWIFLLFIIVLFTSDYIKRRDFFQEEKSTTYNAVNSFNVLAPKGYSVHGIDVSRHNGEIWWEEIAKAKIDTSPISFVFVKVTEGMFFFDREHLDNWNSARKHNMIRGAYHYFRPKYNAAFQAWNFFLHSDLKKGDLPPVLDIEVDEGYSNYEIEKKMRKWLDIVEKHYGVKPIIYTNMAFYKKVVQNRFDNYPIWIAQYKSQTPELPNGKKWLIWQYADKATLYGINGKVDVNVFNGNIDELKALCIP